MRPITVTVGNLAVAGNATALRAASLASVGNILASVFNAGATVDRNILFTFASAEPGLRLELTGHGSSGNSISETIYGPAAPGTVLSVNQYNKVISVVANQVSLGNVSVGTSSVGTSRPVYLDPWAWTPIGVQVVVSGTVNYDIEVCAQDAAFGDPTLVAAMPWIDAPDAALVGKTAAAVGQLDVPFALARIMLNSGSGVVTATFTQPGVVNR